VAFRVARFPFSFDFVLTFCAPLHTKGAGKGANVCWSDDDVEAELEAVINDGAGVWEGGSPVYDWKVGGSPPLYMTPLVGKVGTIPQSYVTTLFAKVDAISPLYVTPLAEKVGGSPT